MHAGAPWSETDDVCCMDILLRGEKELTPKILTNQNLAYIKKKKKNKKVNKLRSSLDVDVLQNVKGLVLRKRNFPKIRTFNVLSLRMIQ